MLRLYQSLEKSQMTQIITRRSKQHIADSGEHLALEGAHKVVEDVFRGLRGLGGVGWVQHFAGMGWML